MISKFILKVVSVDPKNVNEREKEKNDIELALCIFKKNKKTQQ